MIHRYFLLFICLLLPAIQSIAIDINETFYKELISEDIKTISKRGRELVIESPDSAMSYFSVIAARYDREMTREETEITIMAMNDLGYFYFFLKNDPIQSYSYLLRAKELSHEAGIDEWLPHIYVNMANVFSVLDDYDSARLYFQKSFHTSLESGTYNILLTSFIGLINLVFSEHTDGLDSIKKECEAFKRLSIPDIPMKEYTVGLYKGVEYASVGNYENSLRELQKARESIDTPLTPDRYEYVVTSIEGKVHMLAGDYEKGLECYRDILTRLPAPDVRASVYMRLAEGYNKAGCSDSALYYNDRYLSLSDSILHSGQMKALRDLETQSSVRRLNERISSEIKDKNDLKMIVAVVAVFLVIVIGCGLWLWDSRRKLKHANEVLYQKNHDNLYGYDRDDSEKDIEPENETAELTDDVNTQVFMALGNRIKEVMEESPEVFSTEFSVDKLAQLVDAPSRKVSYVINHVFQTTFTRMLQEYRIKEACRRLEDKEAYGHMTIEGISLSLGFRSRSNFIQVFKKITGLTPSDYQKISRSR